VGDELREKVRERYAGVAQAVRDAGEDGSTSCCESSCCGSDAVASEVDDGGGESCCGSSCCGSGSRALEVDMSGGAYSESEKGEIPLLAANASLGCGNPVALATLSPGEVVLDLGSGGGIDVLLSARRVAPGGKAYGLDMTDEMLALARANQKEADVENAEFLKGEIEAVPLTEGHVDVVISNCVINLSTQKERVISEAFRVLKPGGRFAVSDVVFLGEKSRLPAEVVRSVELWSGCVSGALEKSKYEALLSAAGFEDVFVEVTHTYPPELVEGLGGLEEVETLREVPVASAFIRARKPVERRS
jgi:arsenite methyltransferase